MPLESYTCTSICDQVNRAIGVKTFKFPEHEVGTPNTYILVHVWRLLGSSIQRQIEVNVRSGVIFACDDDENQYSNTWSTVEELKFWLKYAKP